MKILYNVFDLIVPDPCFDSTIIYLNFSEIMEDAQFEDAEIEYIGLKFEKENLNDGSDDDYYKVGLHRISGRPDIRFRYRLS